MTKMTFPSQLNDLIKIFQEKWTPFAENEQWNEDDLKQFNAGLGDVHRKSNTALYEQNALKIMDAFALKVPAIILQIINQFDEGSVQGAAFAIQNRMNTAINQAAYYLDGKDCVPFVYQSHKLFQKMQLMQWFLNELNELSKKYPEMTSPTTRCLLGIFIYGHAHENDEAGLSFFEKTAFKLIKSLIPVRQRLPALSNRIAQYEMRHTLTDTNNSTINIQNANNDQLLKNINDINEMSDEESSDDEFFDVEDSEFNPIGQQSLDNMITEMHEQLAQAVKTTSPHYSIISDPNKTTCVIEFYLSLLNKLKNEDTLNVSRKMIAFHALACVMLEDIQYGLGYTSHQAIRKNISKTLGYANEGAALQNYYFIVNKNLLNKQNAAYYVSYFKTHLIEPIVRFEQKVHTSTGFLGWKIVNADSAEAKSTVALLANDAYACFMNTFNHLSKQRLLQSKKAHTLTETQRFLELPLKNGSVLCRMCDGYFTIPRFSQSGFFTSASRSILRENNISVLCESMSTENLDRSMIGPNHYFGTLTKIHQYAYIIDIDPQGLPTFYALPYRVAENLQKPKPNASQYLTISKEQFTWISGHPKHSVKGNYEKINQALSGRAVPSLTPNPGILEFAPELAVITLPQNDASQLDLSEFGAELVKNDQPFNLVKGKEDDMDVVTYYFGSQYADEAVENGQGVFLETHDFTQIMTPLTADAGGFITLGRKDEDGRLQLIGVKVPFGYSIVVNKGTIHGDATFTGTYAMAMTVNHITRATANVHFLKTKNPDDSWSNIKLQYAGLNKQNQNEIQSIPTSLKPLILHKNKDNKEILEMLKQFTPTSKTTFAKVILTWDGMLTVMGTIRNTAINDVPTNEVKSEKTNLQFKFGK